MKLISKPDAKRHIDSAVSIASMTSAERADVLNILATNPKYSVLILAS